MFKYIIPGYSSENLILKSESNGIRKTDTASFLNLFSLATPKTVCNMVNHFALPPPL